MGETTSGDWHQQLWMRLKSRWWLKTTGIVISITAFMVAYFVLLRHPQFAVKVMPLQPVDHWIAFVPWAVLPYASLWIYIGLVPALLRLRSNEMVRYVACVVLLGAIGCACFYFFPTRVPDYPLDWSRWPMVAFLKSTDAAGNACPSLHVAFSVLTAIWMHWLLRRAGAPRWAHAINMAWCVLIVWSTMATRQHVALDVEIGALLGALVALPVLYVRPIRKRAPAC